MQPVESKVQSRAGIILYIIAVIISRVSSTWLEINC